MREDIQKARNAHASLREMANSDQIILRRPDSRIYQNLAAPDLSGRQAAFVGMVDGNQDLRFIAGLGVTRSHIEPTAWNPVALQIEDAEHRWRDRWAAFRDDALLKDMLADGVLPIAYWNEGGPDTAPSLWFDLKRAKENGYNVPSRFLDDRRETSYSESEAWYAASMLVRGNFVNCFEPRFQGLGLRKRGCTLAQHTGGFVIPDPVQRHKTPYIADQLWVFLYPGRKVRLVVLEIDGEVHMTPERQEADRRRDAMLEASGYEVYHVAGWWCRVDSTRVILEFLAAAGIADARMRLIGHDLRTPSDYVCGYCHEPMVRFDQHWIAREQRHGYVHYECLEEIRQEFGDADYVD